MSQEKLARQSDVSTSTVTRLERDLHTPNQHTLIRLAKALDVKPASLWRDVA
jgi:transcriptional regulator with XRE-family HTH domain